MTQIQRIITSLKHPMDFKAIERIPVRRREEVVAFLRPVPSELKGEALADARLMSAWRNLHQESFFTWIRSTEHSMSEWLTEKYGRNNEDLIFMVETADHQPFGHFALYNFQAGGVACEFGRVLRGLHIGPHGGMTLAASSLLRWATRALKVEQFFLEVFGSNHKAISFYQGIGFRLGTTIPLRRIEVGEVIRWEKLTDKSDGNGSNGYAVRMEVGAQDLHDLGCE